MIRELPPEAEWYRPPNHFELVSNGDTRAFLWVAEITRRDIYGVSYRVSRSLEYVYKEEDVLELIKQAARAELFRRIEIEERIPEGSHMDGCMWVPNITRHDDGRITVGNWDAIDLEIGPMGTICSHNPNIDLEKLTLRPGRVICVDGGKNGDQVGPGSGA